MTDEQLHLAFRDHGDIEAFEALVHRYEVALLSYLTHYLHNAARAEDILQETFLHLYQKCDSFTEGRRIRPWLYSIATHLAIDALRSEDRHRTQSLDAVDLAADTHCGELVKLLKATSPSPLEELEMRERAEWIRTEVHRLPDNLRVLVLLIYFQGLSFQEAAEVLRLPLGTVKTRVHTALQNLRKAWQLESCESCGSV